MAATSWKRAGNSARCAARDDGDAPALQRLAQGFQGAAGKFGEFIEE